MNDNNHRVLVNRVVSSYDELKDVYKKLRIELEYPYNYFGDRGFIDVLIKFLGCDTMIFEIKPTLDDFGEGLRQLRKAQSVLERTKYTGEQYQLILATELSLYNINIVMSLIESLAHTPDNFSLQFVDKDGGILQLTNESFKRETRPLPLGISTIWQLSEAMALGLTTRKEIGDIIHSTNEKFHSFFDYIYNEEYKEFKNGGIRRA